MPRNPPRRGDVVRVRLDPVEGHEQAGTRPVLVISSDVINQHSPVILVACITTKKIQRIFPFDAVIDPPEGGLAHRSKVMLSQLRTIDKRRIVGWYGTVSAETMQHVEEALKVATGMAGV